MTPTEQDKELQELYRQVRNNSRVILYTDVMGKPDEDGKREQTSRDDLWAISTAELDKFMQLITADRKRVALEARIQGIEEAHKEILSIVFTYTHHEEPNFCDVDDVSRVAMSWKVKRIAELKAQQEEV